MYISFQLDFETRIKHDGKHEPKKKKNKLSNSYRKTMPRKNIIIVYNVLNQPDNHSLVSLSYDYHHGPTIRHYHLSHSYFSHFALSCRYNRTSYYGIHDPMITFIWVFY